MCLARQPFDEETIIVRADAALYRAKREGRNRVCSDANLVSAVDQRCEG